MLTVWEQKIEGSPQNESLFWLSLRETYSSKDCFIFQQGKIWFKPLDANWALKSWASCIPAGICWGKQAYGLNHIWNMWGVEFIFMVASIL